MSKPQKQLAPEDEVLKRMLNTPPRPHKPLAGKRAATAKKSTKTKE